MTESESVPADAHHHIRRVARGGTINLIGAGVGASATFAMVVVVARGLPRHDAGLFFTATSIFLVISTLTKLGTLTGLVYFIAKMRAGGEEQRIRRCLRTALGPVAAASVGAGLVLAATAVAALQWVHGSGITFAHLLLILAPFVVASALSDAVLAATRGFGTMLPTVVVENITRSLVQLVLCTTVVVMTDNTELLTAAWAAPYVGSLALGAIRLKMLTGQSGSAESEAHDTRAFRSEFWRFTAPRAFASVAQLLLQRLDIVLVAALRGATAAAVYTAATRFLVGGQLGSQAIGSAVQPELGYTLSSGQVERARHVYQTATSWLVLLTWPFYLACAIFPVWVLRIFGHGYTHATDVVVILALSMLVASAAGTVDMVLSMGGKTTWNLINAVVALTVNVTLDLALIPHYGLTGAAIGWSAAILVNNFLPLAQIWTRMNLHPFARPTLIAIAVAGITAGVIPVTFAAVAGESARVLATALVVGAAAFIAATTLGRRALGLDALIHRRSPVRDISDPIGVR